MPAKLLLGLSFLIESRLLIEGLLLTRDFLLIFRTGFRKTIVWRHSGKIGSWRRAGNR